MDARGEISAYLQKTNGDYEKLKNIVNQQDFKKVREFFGYDSENTENDSYIKDLIDQINKADPSNIELILISKAFLFLKSFLCSFKLSSFFFSLSSVLKARAYIEVVS